MDATFHPRRRQAQRLFSPASSILRFMRRTLVLALFATVASVHAHPEIDEALARLNPLIAAEPASAALYLERGELYARHEDGVGAEANYLRAAELNPDFPGLQRARGALALAGGNAAEALPHLDRAIAANAADAEALLLRGRARGALRQNAAALADFNAALHHLASPTPEFFLARAAVCANAADAVASLDEGIARLGSVVTLELRALALEEQLGRVDAAVARLDRLAAQSERRETWLKRRGDVLARAGRAGAARAAYAAAVAAIAELPRWLQQSPDTTRLLAELRRLTASNS